MAEAEARIEVCTKYEHLDAPFELVDEVHCEDGSQDRMQKFIESQPDPTMINNEPEIPSFADPQNLNTPCQGHGEQ